MSNKLWRDASSLILVFRNSMRPEKHSTFDYSLLMLKRSSKSKFMPNAYVFPGGVTDKYDSNTDWRDLLYGCKEHSRPTKDLILKDVPRPFLLQGKSRNDQLERDIAFRISAIRETFEEAGILLYKDVGDSAGKLSSSTLSEWREKVCVDPSEFLNMCKQFNICPDVWSLYEWSDWLTPIGLKEKTQRRFDTLFYITFQDVNLEANPDNQEVTSMQLTDPKTLLQHHIDGKLWLAPPQFWEISRMSNFTRFEDLKNFSAKRESRGCETWLPVLKYCTNGYYSLYPGDDLYLKTAEYDGNLNTEMSSDESVHDEKFKSKNLNRMLQLGLHDYSIQVNIEDPFGHLTPQISLTLSEEKGRK